MAASAKEDRQAFGICPSEQARCEHEAEHAPGGNEVHGLQMVLAASQQHDGRERR
jgi:hypothetical protein